MTAFEATWRGYLGLGDEALLSQCAFDRFRARGPGGQKRNVTDSTVRLRHLPTGLTGEANESRSQHQNRSLALGRLRREIALGLRTPVTLDGYEPPEALALLLEGGRAAPGRREPRYLEAVAEALDLLEACGWRLSDAARLAGASTGALSRLLEREDWLLRAANQRRLALGLRPLRT